MRTDTNGRIARFRLRQDQVTGDGVLRHATDRLKAAAAAVARHGAEAAQAELEKAAEAVSRHGTAAAQAELCNQAVLVVLALLYEADTDGTPANVDAYTGRFLIPAPWGRNGHKLYSLRATEARALSSYLMFLQGMERARRVAPVFLFDRRCWWLNFFDYPAQTAAAEAWGKVEMTAPLFKKFKP